MSLTDAQLQTLKTDIAASEFGALPQNSDSAFEIAAAYNLDGVPDFTVWQDFVNLQEVGDALDGVDLGNMTSANSERLRTFGVMNPLGTKPTRADHRAFFDDVFSGAGGATTRANLDLLWKRLATRTEALLATGTGSTGSPGTMEFVGNINYRDVLNAWAA